MKKFKKIVACLCLVAVMVSMVACGSNTPSGGTPSPSTSAPASAGSSTPTDGKTFKLGQYLPLSGANATYGQDLRNAAELAIKIVNEQGGLNGAKIEHVVYDTTSSTEEAAKITTKLVQVDKVDACLTTPMSSEILASAQTLMDAKTITFAMGTASAVVKPEWTYLYRAAMNNDYTMPMTFDMIKKFGFTNAAVLYSQDETAISMYNLFKKACEDGGVKIVAAETFDTGDTDFSAQITNIIASNPQVVYLSVVGDFQGLTTKQLRQFGYNGIILGKESMTVSQMDVAGVDACNYFAFANPYVTYKNIDDCDIPIMKEFLKIYQEEYGKLPESDWAYRGWDAVMTLYEASKIAGTNDSDSLSAAVDKLSYEGLGGTLDFTSSHEGYQTFNSFILINGKNQLFDTWLNGGGYDEYKKATGRQF
ncbi:MAG: ABC transporter substrate-binding protein [Acetivibrionales bacterium]